MLARLQIYIHTLRFVFIFFLRDVLVHTGTSRSYRKNMKKQSTEVLSVVQTKIYEQAANQIPSVATRHLEPTT
jgi:hypothetical protein